MKYKILNKIRRHTYKSIVKNNRYSQVTLPAYDLVTYLEIWKHERSTSNNS